VAVTSPASGATHELDPRKRRVVRSGGRILRRAAPEATAPGAARRTSRSGRRFGRRARAGLGLTIARRQAHTPGGWTDLDSAAGKESKFVLAFPARAPAPTRHSITASKVASR